MFSCSKDPVAWKTNNLNNNQIGIFGHGGMGIFSLLPMNSKESLSECLRLGADGTEMDVQMSKDGVLFLYHNSTLQEASSCSGNISELNASDVSCTYKSLVKKNIQLISFKDFFDTAPVSEKHIFTFECKLNGNTDSVFQKQFSKTLIEQINFYGLKEKSFIESTDINFLQMLKRTDSSAKLFLYTGSFEEGLKTAKEMKLFGLTFDMNKITAKQILIAHQSNVRVTLFNQQTPNENYKAFQMSPDFIQTDKLEHALKALNKNNK